jgi:N-acetylglucosamine kinase-like BadF-type ATPase
VVRPLTAEGARGAADAGTPGAAGPAPVVGPGANIRSNGPAALDHLPTTAQQALDAAGVQSEQVAATVLGMTGAGPARHAEIESAVRERLASLGLPPGRVCVTDDQLTAFLSGDVGDDGLLLLAGTGAVALRYRGREREAVRDGMGWLLGDVGSAVWLGRRVLEAVAADLDRRGRRTVLTERLGEMMALDLRCGKGQDLIRALDGMAPAQWGRFAPLVSANAGDDVARDLLDRAERHFTRVVEQLDPEVELPVVLAGSVLTSPGPVHDDLVTWMEAAGRTVVMVPDGLSGAVRLAREAAEAADPSADTAVGPSAEG